MAVQQINVDVLTFWVDVVAHKTFAERLSSTGGAISAQCHLVHATGKGALGAVWAISTAHYLNACSQAPFADGVFAQVRLSSLRRTNTCPWGLHGHPKAMHMHSTASLMHRTPQQLCFLCVPTDNCHLLHACADALNTHHTYAACQAHAAAQQHPPCSS